MAKKRTLLSTWIDRGYSVPPETSTVYMLIGSSGEYSDWHMWTERVYLQKSLGESVCKDLNDALKEINTLTKLDKAGYSYKAQPTKIQNKCRQISQAIYAKYPWITSFPGKDEFEYYYSSLHDWELKEVDCDWVYQKVLN